MNYQGEGYVRETTVDIGDRLYEGQPLAIIRAPEVARATAEL